MRFFPESSATRKLERDLDRRRLGGVCSGLARYTGIGVSAVRFIFLGSVFFSFSLTFWLYLVLWIVLPGRRSSVSELSWRLRRKARHLEKLIDNAQARLSQPAARSALEQIHQLVLSLLPDFDGLSRRDGNELAAAKRAVLEQLPTLLEHYLRLPPAYAEGAGGTGAEERLAQELNRLENLLRGVAEQRFYQRIEQPRQIRARPSYSTARSAVAGPPTTGVAATPCGRQGRRRRGQQNLRHRRGLADPIVPPAAGRRPQRSQSLQSAANRPRLLAGRHRTLPGAAASIGPHRTGEPGKTAHALLAEQLDVLDRTLRDMLTSLYRHDAQGLLVHGRFLRDKFVEHADDWLK